jgi:CheY-like chemotaxis protein
MVIEDEPLIAMGLRMVLEAMGCDVRAVVDNSTDAVSAAETENLDLVLADVRLKGGDDGITAVERILPTTPSPCCSSPVMPES